MRVLFVLNGATIGYSGGDLHAVAVANRWTELGHSVTFLMARGFNRDIAQLLDPKVEVVTPVVAGRRFNSKLQLTLEYTIRLVVAATFVLRNRGCWDLAVATSHFPFDVIPVALVSGQRCRRVAYWHHSVSSGASRPGWVRSLVRLGEFVSAAVVRRWDFIIFTPSAVTRNLLVRRGVEACRVLQTANALSFPVGEVEPQTLPPLPAHSRVVLFCGRLSVVKGTRDLRHVAKACLAHASDVILVVCGDGEDGPGLRHDLRHACATGRVVFTGFAPEAVKHALLARAHVLVAPSYEEGWGIIVGEGLAHGAWVVCYDLPAVRHAFPVGPRYVAMGDVEALCAAVLESLERPRPGPVDTLYDWRNIADTELRSLQFV